MAITIWNITKKSYSNSTREEWFVRLDLHEFSLLSDISFDYAVMEKYPDIVVKPLHIEWNDLGEWHRLYDTLFVQGLLESKKEYLDAVLKIEDSNPDQLVRNVPYKKITRL
jgi:mannose-1-phosphate guanylyltransferase